MHDERAAFEPDDQVFRAPLDAQDRLAAHGRFEIRRDGPAQAPIADDHIDDAARDERGRNAAPRGLYFRKLWHRCAGPNRLNNLAGARRFI